MVFQTWCKRVMLNNLGLIIPWSLVRVQPDPPTNQEVRVFL